MKKLAIFTFCALLVACGGNSATSTGETQTTNQTTNEMKTDTIALLPVETIEALEKSGATIFDALKNRASVREYTAGGLTLEQLSGVMWAAAGQNRADGHLTAPSAMGLYPIRTYAVLPAGIYLYDAPTHSLTRVVEGNFMTLTGLQDFVYTAPLNIMYIADLSKYATTYAGTDETMQMFLCGLDAAGYCQNANLWAAAHGLGAVTRAGAKGEEFLKAISAPETFRFVLAQSIGVTK